MPIRRRGGARDPSMNGRCDRGPPLSAPGRSTSWLPLFGFALLAAPAAAAQPADLVLRGGRIVTMDDRRPEAEALALAGDRIAAVGDADEINKLVSEKTRIIEPKGELVAPAFVEGHGHFVGLGQSKMILDLSAAKSWEEIVQLVEETAGKTPPGQWIVGRGWHQDKWVRAPTPNVEGCPTHVQLSRATPRHPVMLTHATGHMCLANALAMERAGVEERAASASGGEILNATSSPCCCRNCSRGSNCRCGP